MEAPSPRSRIGGSWTSQMLATRRGAMTIAALAAVLAGVLLYLFVQHYKKNPTAPAVPSNVYVFVASKYIAAGTPAQTIDAEGLLRRTEVPTTQAVAGAIPDPSAISGQVTSTSIAAGQQISVNDFTHTNVSIGAYLTGTQRAISVSLDPAHGLSSYLSDGNTVDVMVENNGQTTMLAQNVSVLGNQNGTIVLRVTDKQALQIASAADAAKLWLVLRPPTGGQVSIPVGAKAGY